MNEPRCLTCGYLLTGLQSGQCPECGRKFDPENPASYSTKPPFVRWRFWMPAALLSIALGAGLMSLFVISGGFGWSFTIVGPFVAGVLLGYAARVRKFVYVLLALIVVAGVVTGLASMSFVGVFCGLVTAGVILGPLLIGTFLGVGLRVALKASQFDQRSYLPMLMTILLALASGQIESLARKPAPLETIGTTKMLDVDRARAWRTMLVYEEVHATPSLLLRMLLPRPLGTRGKMESVGDVKTCIYTRGYLRKQVISIEPEKRLTFSVIEQVKIENRSVRLDSGSFEFGDAGAGHTRVTLNTTYEPLLAPRWVWRPFEAWAVHSLHDYVLQGMEHRAHELKRQQLAIGATAQ